MAIVFQNNKITQKTAFLPRIAQADKSAARECVDAYGAMIWALTKESFNSNITAEKVVQEIFLDIWENAASCDLTISDEKNWIAMIARRRLARYSTENLSPGSSIKINRSKPVAEVAA